MSIKTANNQRLLRRIRVAATGIRIVAWLTILGNLALAIYELLDPALVQQSSWEHLRIVSIAIPNGADELSIWLSLLPKAIIIYGLFRLTRVLQACETGSMLSAAVAGHLQAFAACVLLWEVLRMFLPLEVLGVLWLTQQPLPEQTNFFLMGGDLWSVFLAALFLVMSWILREAARLADDNASII